MAIFPKRQRIAVVQIFGTIGGRVKSPVFERVFNEVRRSKSVKAVVLDIDSPGGAVPASDYLYRSVERLAREKPVVASIRPIQQPTSPFIGLEPLKTATSDRPKTTKARVSGALI